LARPPGTSAPDFQRPESVGHRGEGIALRLPQTVPNQPFLWIAARLAAANRPARATARETRDHWRRPVKAFGPPRPDVLRWPIAALLPGRRQRGARGSIQCRCRRRRAATT